jgi:sugar O-acyltransferase (sialic acid O-acetyltransferase NeuD family)
MTKRIFGIIGCGGFGREVLPIVEQNLASEISAGAASVTYVLEDHYPPVSRDGRPVLRLSEFAKVPGEKYYCIAIADGRTRARIDALCKSLDLRPFDVRSPQSSVSASCSVGEGSIIAPFALISVNARIGRSLHLNYYACITHDCVVGDFVTFGPRAQCNGGVVIEDGVYIGAGALIKDAQPGAPIVIGRNAVIGMGAVVLRSVEPNTVVVGNPARLLSRA